MRLGIYVGSFNPVHIGHIKFANDLVNKNILDKVIIIPTKNYWDKKNLIPLSDRYNMLKLVESENVKISKRYSSYEYTYQILNDISKIYAKDEIYLIIGADQLPKFHLWKNVDKILKYKILVINRNNINTYEYINKFDDKDSFIVVEDIDTFNISSTKIREDIDNMSNYLDSRVYKYIKKNKLY